MPLFQINQSVFPAKIIEKSIGTNVQDFKTQISRSESRHHNPEFIHRLAGAKRGFDSRPKSVFTGAGLWR